MKTVQKLTLMLLGLAIFGALFVLIFEPKQNATMQAKQSVSVSSFTLHDVVSNIAGESVNVVNILPLGVDPHSFEPTPKLMAQIEQSDLVIYSGAGLEPWTHGFAFKGRAVDMSEHVTLLELDEHDEHDEYDEHDEHDAAAHHEHHHGEEDPHYWLDFKNMQKVANVVRDELIALQPTKRSEYEQNTQKYVAMLDKLDSAYKQRLASCKLHTVVINHNALGYLAHNYGFEVESLSGLAPEAQPNPQQIVHLFETLKRDKIQTVFFESFVNNRDIIVVAKDANVTLEVFQVLGNITQKELDQNLSYEEIMYENLEKLSKALECN